MAVERHSFKGGTPLEQGTIEELKYLAKASGNQGQTLDIGIHDITPQELVDGGFKYELIVEGAGAVLRQINANNQEKRIVQEVKLPTDAQWAVITSTADNANKARLFEIIFITPQSK